MDCPRCRTQVDDAPAECPNCGLNFAMGRSHERPGAPFVRDVATERRVRAIAAHVVLLGAAAAGWGVFRVFHALGWVR